MGFRDQIARLFGRGGQPPKPLPRATVQNDGVDRVVYSSFKDDSPRFRSALDDPPIIPPATQEPDPIDFTSASPEEIAKWQEDVKAAREAAKNAPPYDAFEDLARDLFYLYHHAEAPKVLDPSEVDPGVAAHAKIMQKIAVQSETSKTRNVTRDDGTMAAIATTAGIRSLKESLTEELLEQARQSERFEQARDDAQALMDKLESLRNEARDQAQDQGGQIDPDLVQQIREAVQQKRAAQAQAAQIADESPVAFDKAAHDAVVKAAGAAAEAAEAAAGVPSFGQGFGQGEPVYESPEQALTIAEMWANSPKLRQVAELYGRMFSDFHFKRSKRVIGGQDEIVDVKVGDEIRRALMSELALLADEDYEDDFFARALSGELLVYSTVGEELAGRGPMGLVVDGSYSMATGDPTRNVWARALALALLNTARREKRDFFLVEFSDGPTQTWFFPAKQPLDPQAIVDMASHFFGGGTNPLSGVKRGVDIMAEVPEFKKADLVLISDGEAGFGPEDKRMRDWLDQKGVRIHGVAIGEGMGYLQKMCTEQPVLIHDFELAEPNDATTQLATSIN